MKKLICILLSMMILGTTSFAQEKKVKKTKGKTVKTKSTKTENPATSDALAAKQTEVKTKKDGTPDKRYKENKDAAATTPKPKVKKDGTADKRYKENKDDKKRKL